MTRIAPPELVFVSGMSGAGKSVALDMLEDLDFFCIDNLPLALAASLNPTELARHDRRYLRIAVGIDARASANDMRVFPEYIRRTRADHPDYTVRVIFLTASTDVLMRRFSETRRRHPLTDDDTTLEEALRREHALMTPVAEIADISLDTSSTNLHELRERIRSTLHPGDTSGGLAVVVQSFGFKYGAPRGLDLMFDVRCLPNPHWSPELREQTGRDPAVQQWLAAQEPVVRMQQDICDFLARWIPAFSQQDRHYLTVGIGCTGGKHRSVYLAEQVARTLRSAHAMTSVRHTELS
ncbi:MAG: RNase adapter RapZ [Oceanococcaceae bacterium]